MQNLCASPWRISRTPFWTNPGICRKVRTVKENNNGDDVLSRAAWHPAFVEAIKEELEEYWDILEFHDEYQLTSEPLRIDCVIIKKAKGAIVRKDIAAIFRGVNLLEYKSPSESLSVNDFYKVHSYATLYASLNDTPVADITVSFVGSRYPREVIRHLEGERGYTVEKTAPGIYTVAGSVFPVQLIDSRKLSARENQWLRNLRALGTKEGVSVIRKMASQKHKVGKRLRAYLAVIARHNALAVQEVIDMGGTAAVDLETVLENAGLIAKWEAQGEVKGKAEQTIEIARKCIEHGFPIDAVVSVTGLDPERVRELAGGIYQ